MEYLRLQRSLALPGAAAANEARLFVRNFGQAAMLALRGENGDVLTIFPSLTHPFVRFAAVANATTLIQRGLLMSPSGTAAAATILNTILGIRQTTAASANAEGTRDSTANLRCGSAVGDGFLTWGLFETPDASYGAGATGSKVCAGVKGSGGVPNSASRPINGTVSIEWNAAENDINWQGIVNVSGTNVIADLGVPFVPAKAWFYVIHHPRGTTKTWFLIINLTDGVVGAVIEVNAASVSTALGEFQKVVTFAATARAITFGCVGTAVGGSL